jgi:hypothetical protein
MKGITICLGHTLLTDAPGGGKQIAGMTGHLIGGLSSMQATTVQDVLLNEFKDELDAFLKPVLSRLTELGYMAEVSLNGANPAEIEENRALLKKANKAQ